jgi:hypothetical protein
VKASGGLLGRLGIDSVQYRALVRTALLMDFRGHPLARRRGPSSAGKTSSTTSANRAASTSPVRGLVIMSLVQGLCSTALALGALRARLALEILCLSYSSMLCATAMLADYSAQLLLPDDTELLGHRPIAPRTLFAARATNVLFYMTLIGVSLNFPPAFIGIAAAGLSFPLCYLPVAFLANYVAVGAVLALQAALLRLLDRERFKDVLAYVQGGLALAIFASYQLVPRLTRPLAVAQTDAPRWTLLIPPAWFAGLCEVLNGRRGPVLLALTALAVGLSAVVMPLALRRIASQYGEEPLRFQSRAEKAPEGPGAPVRSRLFRLASHRLQGPARAGFELAWANLARDRVLKMQLIPVLALPIAMLVGMRADRGARLGDPFTPGTAPMFAATYMTVALLAFLTRYLAYSANADAAWLFEVAPLARPQDLWRGARRALAVRLIAPVVLVFAVALSVWIPLYHALLHLGVAAASGLVLASLVGLGQRSLPFSLPRQRATGRLLGTILGTYVFVGSVGGLHAWLAWHVPAWMLGGWAVAATLLALALFRLGDRRLARRFRRED